MSWRDNEIARDALAVQGYLDEETGNLRQDLLAAQLQTIFMQQPVRASKRDILDRKADFIAKGVSKTELVEAVLPGFLDATELDDDERALLKKDPKEHPDLEERAQAVTDLGTLLWGSLSRTSRAGAAQKLIVTKGLLLIEAKVSREGAPVTLKAATDDHDLIIEWYVRPRGDQLVKVSGGVRDDCMMVALAFDGISDRLKKELGSSVTTAVGNLMQVAAPDFAALQAGGTTTAKALGPGAVKR